VSDHLPQPKILPQTLKVVDAFAPGRVENYEALDEGGFIVASLPLFDLHLLPHAFGKSQRAEGLHNQRNSAQRGNRLRQRLGINLEQQRRFGGRRLRFFAHAAIIPEPRTPWVRNLHRGASGLTPCHSRSLLAPGVLPCMTAVTASQIIDGSGAQKLPVKSYLDIGFGLHYIVRSTIDRSPGKRYTTVSIGNLAGFTPQQTSLRVQVVDFLRDSILAGKLKPGDRIVERTLAKTLGVGQATVREALQTLEHDGLILKKANTASFVTQLSAEQVAQIVDIRLDLEPKAFALAHRRMTPAHLDELQSLVARIEEGVANNDYFQVERNDFTFHQKVWKIAGNQTLEKILTQLCTPLFAYLMVFLSTSNSPLRERVKSHQILVDALKGAEEEKVIQAARDHTSNSWYQFLPGTEGSRRRWRAFSADSGEATFKGRFVPNP
jgi:DNA-binding GntR family transcriptional regulator